MSTTGMTENELRIVEALADVWNAYLELPVEHPMDRNEFCHGIHDLQAWILMRPARRALNQGTRAGD